MIYLLIIGVVVIIIYIATDKGNPTGKDPVKDGHRGLKFLLGILVIALLFTLYGVYSGISRYNHQYSSYSYGSSYSLTVSMVNGISGAFEFLLLSIICTAGASLVVYLPTAYLFGSGVLGLIRLMRGRRNDTYVETQSVSRPVSSIIAPPPINAIQAYYYDSLQKGLPKEQIITNLRTVGGWSEAEINASIPK